MNHLNFVCLSLTTNLRCFGFTLGQCAALLIPPAAEVVISLFFIYLYSGPDRFAQAFLVADSFLYFIWTLLDMLSRVLPIRGSLPVFKALDSLVGAVSFTPILFYSIYLYRLSFRDFIPTLPRRLQPYLEISLPVLLVIAVAINEVSSFLGFHLGNASGQPLVSVGFPHNSEHLWLSLSQSSLAVYTTIQLLFLLLALSRLFTAFLDQRRIELAHSDEHHYFNGIAWITGAITIAIIETILGLVPVSFGVSLARRILHLIARGTLMFGSLKGLDVAENFENLEDELRGMSRINKHISSILGITPRRNMFRRISQSHTSKSSRREECSQAEKQPGDQRVTVHCENGRPPFLQIRFSEFNFPERAVLADTLKQRRSSFSGVASGCAQQRKSVSDDMVAVRTAMLETTKAKSDTGHDDSEIRPPEKIHTRPQSGGTVSDNLSIVRDLERKFPNLPPRVTGRYRGSILGEKYEDDPFPVVGVSRQSSLRRDDDQRSPSDEDGAPVTLSPSGSIKRKPAPPLLENIAYFADRRRRRTSAWGGLKQNTSPAESPTVAGNPWEGTTNYSPNSALGGEPNAPRSRKKTARDVIKRASQALSDVSIRSAEWFASATSPQSARTPLTALDIEMYRKGTLGPGSTRPVDDEGDDLFPNEDRLETDGEFKGDATTPSSRLSRISIGKAI